MNAFEAGVVARLKAANLLDVAERAARRVELRLADCIAPGDVTGGHRAVWAALAREKKTVAQIAEIVAFPIADVRREMGTEVPQAPESGPRIKKAAKAVIVPPALPPMTTRFAARLAALEEHAEDLTKTAQDALRKLGLVTYELHALRAELAGLDVEMGRGARALAVEHLRTHGDTGEALSIAERHGVSAELLLSGSMQRDVCAARREIALLYVLERKLSHAQVSRMLNVTTSAVTAYVAAKRTKEAA